MSFLPTSREMDCTDAGREWGDEDCPPRPGTFSESDGMSGGWLTPGAGAEPCL